jgi:hypothetical protein
VPTAWMDSVMDPAVTEATSTKISLSDTAVVDDSLGDWFPNRNVLRITTATIPIVTIKLLAFIFTIRV